MTKHADVFISYSTKDSSIAHSLCKIIEEHGIICWIAPRDVQPGTHYAEEVLDAIEQTQAAIVLLSDYSNCSAQVRNEVERVVSKGKPVLPVRIQNVLPSRSLELYLSASQWIDAWASPLAQQAEQIVKAINALLSSSNNFIGPIDAKVGVIALGGGAIRATASLLGPSPYSLHLIAAHSYGPTLESCKFPVKVLMGRQLLGGNQNCGGDPGLGKIAAEEVKAELLRELTGLNLVFVIACLGGGAGTGAAPVVCSLSREMGILTIGVVTTPFQMEGTRRSKVAAQGLSELSRSADSVILIPNQRLLQRGIPSGKAFFDANFAIVCSVRSVSDLIFIPGFVNVDFADVRQIFQGTGIGRIGIGKGSGGNAAMTALTSSFLDGADLNKTRSIIINITGGSRMTIYSISEVANIIQNEINDEADVVFGNVIDESIDNDTIIVTLIAMGTHVR